MLQNFKISSRLRTSFLLLNVLMAGFNIHIIYEMNTIHAEVESTIRSHNNQTLMRDLLADFFQARSDMWSYYATGDEARWNSALTAGKDIEEDLANLKKLTIVESRKKALSDLTDYWHSYLSEMTMVKEAVDKSKDIHSADVTSALKKTAITRAALDKLAEDLTNQYKKSASDKWDDTVSILNATSTLSITFGITALLLGLLIAFVIARSISKPLHAMTHTMDLLAKGDLKVTVPSLDCKDEIGEMAQSVEVFKENAVQVAGLRKDQEQAAARSAKERREALNKMAQDFEDAVLHIVKDVSKASSQLHESAKDLSQAAQESSAQATAVGAAATQTTTNVQTVASAAEELTASIHEITTQVEQAAKIATSASDETHKTNQLVQDLAEAVAKIGSVVELISDIASQTNLLALNATIEAARAGEAGKGFAVVASEVKNLANQTSRATEEIGAQIAAVQSGTKNAVDAIHGIGGIIDQVRQISSSIAASVEQQGAATNEIARNVQQASQGTQEVSRAIENVSRAAGMTGSGADAVLHASGELAGDANQLHKTIEVFIKDLRVEKKAELMPWTDALKIGITSIDTQHHKLVDLLNDLYNGFESGEANEAVGRVLDGLIDYTANHFGYEEELFLRTGYAESKEHKKEHDALVKQVLEVQANFRKKAGTVLTQDVMLFLKNWLVNHIQGTDRRYAPHMKAHGID